MSVTPPTTAPREPAARKAAGLLSLLLIVSAAGAATAAAQAPPSAAPPAAPAVDEQAETAAAEALQAIDHAVAEHDPKPIAPALVKFEDLRPKLQAKTIKKLDRTVTNMFAKLKPREEADVDTLGQLGKLGRFGPDSDSGSNPIQVTDGKPQVLDAFHVAIGLLYDKPEGPELLLPVLKLPHVKTWPELQALVIEGLGFREDPAQAKDFQVYLGHEHPLVASAAATALGRLREQPQDVRRKLVTMLIDAYANAQKQADRESGKLGDEGEHPAKQYVSNIQVAFCEALTSLTRQNFSKASEWRTWFEAHGKDASW